MKLTEPMARFIAHFAELGPRWGLNAETCRAHTLLYLAGRPMTLAEIAQSLGLAEKEARAAIDDLVEWGMARPATGEAWDASGEPWDLLFSALEQRRRREIDPALRMLRECRDAASKDGVTEPGVRSRIARMLSLVEDIAAIDTQSRRLPQSTLIRLVGLGGRAARLLDRALPTSRPQRSA